MKENASRKSKLEKLLLYEDWAEFRMKNYMRVLSNAESEMIFRTRTRMLMIKVNMKKSYKDLVCRICNEYEENQKHVIEECVGLKEVRAKYLNDSNEVKEQDAFSEDEKKLKTLGRYLREMMEFIKNAS